MASFGKYCRMLQEQVKKEKGTKRTTLETHLASAEKTV